MNKKTLSFSLFLLLIYVGASAQRIPINVNHSTGTAVAVVPIVEYNTGLISVPVSMVYGSNGLKVDPRESSTGLGWSLSAGGQVSRKVRGIPDDVEQGTFGATRLGWLKTTNGSKINSFSIANDNNPAGCADEQADLNYINSNFADNTDTEPDLFSVSAPGLAFDFMFDNYHSIQKLSYQDVQITYQLDESSHMIKSFTVINDKGIKYIFSKILQATKETTRSISPTSSPTLPESEIKYFRREYFQWVGGIKYNEMWMLTSMTDPNGNDVYFEYKDLGVSSDRKEVAFAVGGGEREIKYIINETHEVKVLGSFSNRSESCTFNYGVDNKSDDSILGSITAKGVNYIFNYSSVNLNSGQVSYHSYALRNITTDQCNSPLNVYFSYEGETQSPHLNPDTHRIFGRDMWGYSSGTATIGLGPVNPATVTVGMLKQISGYDGGKTTLEYESNNYYDPTTASVVSGGGVRIKKITDYNGINPSQNMVREFSYLNQVNGVSSGIPLSLPANSFFKPVPTSANAGNSSVVSEEDMSEEDHTVMYKYVTETQAGKGSTRYEYEVPAGSWDNSVALGDWAPTISYVAVPSCATSRGVVSNTARTYPFAPNINYDFQRGLLKQQTDFNGTGEKVSQTTYTYQRSNVPVVINALKIEDNDYAKVYSKYSVYAGTSNLVAQVDKIVFDPLSQVQGLHSTKKIVYGDVTHKNPTREETENGDGSVSRNNFIYSKSFTGSSIPLINALNQRNINIALEVYSEVKAAGSSVFKTVSAQLTKYTEFEGKLQGQPNILPLSQFKLVSSSGLTDFVPITSNGYVGDSRYLQVASFPYYDRLGYLKTQVGIDKMPTTFLQDSLNHQQVAAFKNAYPQEVGYINFEDYQRPESFIQNSSNFQYIRDRSGNNGWISPVSGVFSRMITKKSSAKTYIFSIWIKSAVSGAVNLTATGGSAQTAVLNYAANADWKYYEVKIPVQQLSAQFTLSFTTAANVAIDEIMLYPDIAEVNTASYSSITGQKITETNTNGVSAYYDKDRLGRINLIYDQDKQITYRKTYFNEDLAAQIPDADFYINQFIGDKDVFVNKEYSFLMVNNFNLCRLPGAVFSWNYGDGSAPTSSSLHTFSAAGKYNVTLTVTVPGIGTKSRTTEITVLPQATTTVSLSFINNTPSSGLTKLEFLQGTTVVKTVLAAEVFTTKIDPGDYTLRVTCYGTDTDISVVVETDNSPQCQDWVHSNKYTYSVSASGSISITLNPSPCE